MTKTLTEQWYDNTLDRSHHYYVRIKGKEEMNCGGIDFIDIIRPPLFRDQFDKLMKYNDPEVLAPVPTYEEWKKAKENIEKNGTWYTERAYKRIEKQLAISTKALKETKEKLLHVELSGLDGDNRQKMYDLMFEDGVIDKALKEMEGVK